MDKEINEGIIKQIPQLPISQEIESGSSKSFDHEVVLATVKTVACHPSGTRGICLLVRQQLSVLSLCSRLQALPKKFHTFFPLPLPK